MLRCRTPPPGHSDDALSPANSGNRRQLKTNQITRASLVRVILHLIVLIAITAALCPCVELSHHDVDPLTRLASENALREAVLRYLMDSWLHEESFKVFFVDVNAQDPTDDFLKRFQGVPRIIAPMSRAQMDSNSMDHGFPDVMSHQRGVILVVRAIRC